MPRRREVPKRVILPDPKYGDLLVAKFINGVMSGELVNSRSGNNPLETFKSAMDNLRPLVEVKSRRVGGSTYQVPVEVAPSRRTAMAIRWLITYARQRNEKTMRERLAGEFMDAAAGRGAAVKKKEDTHRMAEANKAFAHYRW
jgi:small subunit ribosomal protein S7